MLPDKSDMLEHIKATIIKCVNNKQEGSINHTTATGEPGREKPGMSQKGLLFQSKNGASIKKMEQRIKALEEQNDHLIYFIYFLFEKIFECNKNISMQGSNANRSVQQNGIPVNGNSMPIDLPHNQKADPCPTRREMEILTLLIKGLCAKEIAHMLFISETTVITHKKNLKEKFQAKNTVELISKAYDILCKPVK